MAASRYFEVRISRGGRQPLREPGYFFSTFQNTVTGEGTLPLTFLRRAMGCTYWPSGTVTPSPMMRAWTFSAISSCFLGSGSRTKAARSFSTSSSSGQPNWARSPLASA